MRRVLVQTAAWAAATGAAVSVSWFGVHRVLADDGYQQPSALGLTVAGSVSLTPAPLPTTIGTATQLPQSPTATATRRPSPGHSRSAAPGDSSGASSSAPPGPTGDVHSYTPPGGRIVVSMGASSADLVSATPDSGWGMHVYTGDEWLRVDFTQGSTDSIFYVTWNGHPPMVQTWLTP